MFDTETFNGWKNHATWNVALWLQNDEFLYKHASDYVKECKKYGRAISYDSLIPSLECYFGKITPDGVRWMNPEISTEEVDRMLAELTDTY